MSRKAATNGRAVLEGVHLDTATINTCFMDITSEEDAVHAGLNIWIEGKGKQPPTWELLLDAMAYAGIAQQHVHDLKKELGLLHYKSMIVCTLAHVL